MGFAGIAQRIRRRGSPEINYEVDLQTPRPGGDIGTFAELVVDQGTGDRGIVLDPDSRTTDAELRFGQGLGADDQLDARGGKGWIAVIDNGVPVTSLLTSRVEEGVVATPCF